MTEDLRSRHGFTQCLEPLADELVAFARRMVIHRDDAEDVLQASLAAAWNHRARFQAGTNFRAWVFRFVVHEALNSNRRRSSTSSRVKALADDVPDREFWRRLDAEQAYRELLTDPPALLQRLDEQLASALEALRVEERTVLLLRAVAGLRCAEIADVLDVPKGTIMARLFRARLKLRERLGQPGRCDARDRPLGREGGKGRLQS